VGLVLSEVFDKGLYKGDYFLNLMRDLLAAKGKRTFRDFLMPEYADDPRYRFKVRLIASDITRGRMLALPQDVADYGRAPEDLEVALAVRMSMSIPFFFTPVAFRHANGETCYIVDGALLSNFPVELFDSDGPPAWPTFGFKLVQGDDGSLSSVVRHPINGPLSELAAMFFTAMEAHDAYYLKAANFVRTITIDTDGVAATDFNLTAEQKDTLYASGVAAAQEFLQHWDFERYKAEFRSGQPVPSRRERLMPTVTPAQP
jgi:NTE family protein